MSCNFELSFISLKDLVWSQLNWLLPSLWVRQLRCSLPYTNWTVISHIVVSHRNAGNCAWIFAHLSLLLLLVYNMRTAWAASPAFMILIQEVTLKTYSGWWAASDTAESNAYHTRNAQIYAPLTFQFKVASVTSVECIRTLRPSPLSN